MVAAVSASWEDRASAARLLAGDPDDISMGLMDRLLADEDLAVAEAAAAALLGQADSQAVAQFTSAYLSADDQLGDHFNDVLVVAVQVNPGIVAILERLSRAQDAGAQEALAWLAGG